MTNADKTLTNSQRYSEAVHVIMYAKCDCGDDAAVKHGDLIYCAPCWMEKFGPANYQRKELDN